MMVQCPVTTWSALPAPAKSTYYQATKNGVVGCVIRYHRERSNGKGGPEGLNDWHSGFEED